MIETITVQADVLPGRRGREGLWPRFRGSASGSRFWAADAKQLPDGVGSLALIETPTGDRALRVEANLTSVLYGSHRKYASLQPDDLPDALGQVLDVAGWAVPGVARSWSGWRVKRYDPSATFAVGGDLGTVIDSARTSWRRAAGRREYVADLGSSVRWQRGKHRSWSVYDKSAEHGPGCPPGLVRVEARRILRERLALDEWRSGMAEDEMDAMVESLAAVAGETLRQTIEHLMRGGASSAEALKLAGPAVMIGQYGEHALVNLGLPEATARRYRARIRALLESAGELPEPKSGAAVLADAERVYARDVG